MVLFDIFHKYGKLYIKFNIRKDRAMKIRNYLTILFAVVAIILLLGLAGFMTYYAADDSNPVKQQIATILPMEEIFDFLHLNVSEYSVPVNTTEASTEQATAVALKEHSFLFVGDSRTLGMKDATGDSCTYLGAEGEGYSWFSGDGVLALADYLGSNPSQTVILNLGVNDPENINVYIDLYKKLISEYPSSRFYILSVNPLDEHADFNTTNEMIELFNATMKSSFPDNYLDCYSYLKETGFETVDGLHYSNATYQKIHQFVVDSLA